MKVIELSTSASQAEDARSIDCPFEKPETVAEAVEMWEEDIVLSLATAQAKVQNQALVRRLLKKEGDEYMTDDAILDKVADWKPSQGPIRKSPVEKAKANLKNASKDDIAAMIAELQAELEAGGDDA